MQSPNTATRPLPLKGFRVLDLTSFLSGPFCTQILADMGAEVVKVESLQGDSSRTVPPYFVDGESAYYLGINRNKASLAINMKEPEGLALVRQLIAKVDVVVENYRPGVVERMGLDIKDLTTSQPGLIWASISGFGQTGPWKDKPAYDMIVQALSGVMSLTGEPGGAAMRLGIPAGDIVAGMYTAIAINGALADKVRSGLGRIIDVSMLDCQLAMLSYQSTYALIGGAKPGAQGARHDSIPTYRSFKGGDGRELVVTANTDRMWRGLCEALGLKVLVSDDRFVDPASRLKNKDALWVLLEAAFAQRDTVDWIEPLTEKGVPVALIKTVNEALDDARMAERSMVMPLSDQAGNSIEVVGNPIKFAGEAEEPARYPPVLGEDAARILGDWLEMDAAAMRDLHEKNVLGGAQATQAAV